MSDTTKRRSGLSVPESRKGYTGFLSLVWLLFKEWRVANKIRFKVRFDGIEVGGKWL